MSFCLCDTVYKSNSFNVKEIQYSHLDNISYNFRHRQFRDINTTSNFLRKKRENIFIIFSEHTREQFDEFDIRSLFYAYFSHKIKLRVFLEFVPYLREIAILYLPKDIEGEYLLRIFCHIFWYTEESREFLCRI